MSNGIISWRKNIFYVEASKFINSELDCITCAYLNPVLSIILMVFIFEVWPIWVQLFLCELWGSHSSGISPVDQRTRWNWKTPTRPWLSLPLSPSLLACHRSKTPSQYDARDLASGLAALWWLHHEKATLVDHQTLPSWGVCKSKCAYAFLDRGHLHQLVGTSCSLSDGFRMAGRTIDRHLSYVVQNRSLSLLQGTKE